MILIFSKQMDRGEEEEVEIEEGMMSWIPLHIFGWLFLAGIILYDKTDGIW